MKLLLTSMLLLFSLVSYSQHYAYSYKGKLTIEQQTALITEIEQLNYFVDIKCFQKENGGELQFYIPVNTNHSENEAPVSITAIKEKLINKGCEPSTFIELGN
ncbi:MAG: hypothetical protein IT221_02220 [Fluviicola sp.]|nr:hypothetical protein [Fluviicola sp.]